MSSQSYTLNGTAPTPIYPGGIQSTILVKNVGGDTVWVGSDSNLSTMNGHPIGAGSSLTWSPNTPLYALGSSASSAVLISFDIGNLFDAEAIAAQISISGAPPLDVNTEILNELIQVTAGQPLTLGPIDVSSYQSIKVWAVDEGGNGAVREVALSWGNDTNPANNGVFYVYDNSNFAFLDQGPSGGGVYKGSWATYATATRGAKVRLDIGATAYTSYVHIVVVGSYKVVNIERYYQYVWDAKSSGLPANCIAGGNGSDGLIGFSFNPGAGAAVKSWYFPSVNGPAKLIAEEGGAGSLSIGIVDVQSGIYLVPGLTVNDSSATSEIKLPCRPLYCQINNAGGSAWSKMHLQIAPN